MPGVRVRLGKKPGTTWLHFLSSAVVFYLGEFAPKIRGNYSLLKVSGLYGVVVYPHETTHVKHILLIAYKRGLRAESWLMKSIRMRKYAEFKDWGVVGPKRVIV